MEKNYPRFVMNGSLTGEHFAFFHANGFIHFKEFITNEQVNAILTSLYKAQAYLVVNNVPKVKGVPVKYGFDVGGGRIIHRFPFTSHYSGEIHHLLLDSRLNELKKLMPPGARIAEDEKDGVVVNHYVNTERSEFRKMGWHTDSVRDLFYGGRIMPMLNVGIYLDDSSEEKGGLRVLPGTHHQKLIPMLFRKLYFLSGREDKNEMLIEAKAGDLVIHDGRIWHRVAQSPLTGEASRRRVMYIPMICGRYSPKSENSPMPLYHRLQRLVG